MKAIVSLSLAVSLLTGTALAADLVVEPAAPIYSAESAYDWNGFYLGINGGFGGGTFEHPFELTAPGPTDIASGSIDITAGGFVGGVQAGVNMQMDNFVLGLEGDIQGATVEGRASITATALTDIGPIDDGDSIDLDAGTTLDYFGTLRGRAGVVLDRALVYATAGLAFGRTTSSINASVNGTDLFGDDLSSENDRFGYAAGVGLEYALTDNLTFKTEYLYTDLGTKELVSGTVFDPIEGSLDSTVSFHTVRAGLNFQF